MYGVGNVTTKANATVTVTTNRQNLSTGTVTIVAKATVTPDGSRINVADGSVLIKKWDGIVPGASMTWRTSTNIIRIELCYLEQHPLQTHHSPIQVA